MVVLVVQALIYVDFNNNLFFIKVIKLDGIENNDAYKHQPVLNFSSWSTTTAKTNIK